MMNDEMINEVVEQVQENVAEAVEQADSPKGKIVAFIGGFVAGVVTAGAGIFVAKKRKDKKAKKELEKLLEAGDERATCICAEPETTDEFEADDEE